MGGQVPVPRDSERNVQEGPTRVPEEIRDHTRTATEKRQHGQRQVRKQPKLTDESDGSEVQIADQGTNGDS